MASALLVEVLVSILQHPQGAQAPAPKTAPGQANSSTEYERDPPNHPLGLVPHQIRGFLSSFQNKLISGQSYDCCSACSPKVRPSHNLSDYFPDIDNNPQIVEAYNKGGWDFIKRALTEKDYVTELSGLAEVHRQAEAAANDVDWDSGSEGVEEGEGELL
jgi:ubiquitin-like modifier-activating enzyme ATG7